MKQGISRRAFIKQSGLAMGGFWLMPGLLTQGLTSTEQSSVVVDFAVDYALQKGAAYADARIGLCRIEGAMRDFRPVSLLQQELLGLRIGDEEGWKFLLINDLSEEQIRRAIDHAFDSSGGDWEESELEVYGQFPQKDIIAAKSSDPEAEEALQLALTRYRAPQLRRAGTDQLLYCHLLSDC